jgi:hypothetical protein
MASQAQRRLVRLGVVAALAFFALVIAPATAAACTEEDPQGPGQLDVCSVSFSTPYPTANGQTVTDYAIVNIPKNSNEVHPTLSFSPMPANANLSQSPVEFNPTSKNPDGSVPSHGPGEETVRVIWTWTGEGSSSPGSGTATFSVEFEETAIPMGIFFSAKNPAGEAIDEVTAGQRLIYEVTIENPNDDPVSGRLNLALPSAFRRTSTLPTHGITGCTTDPTSHCDFDLAAGERAVLIVKGSYPELSKGPVTAAARAAGFQVSDGQDVTSALVEEKLNAGCRVGRGLLLSRPTFLSCGFGKTPDVALGGPGKVPVSGGSVKLPVRNGNSFKLTGTLSLTSPTALRTARLARPVTIASKHFRAPPGGKVRVKLSLSGAARRTLAQKHGLRVTETARVKDPAGHKRTVSRRLKLVG